MLYPKATNATAATNYVSKGKYLTLWIKNDVFAQMPILNNFMTMTNTMM